MLTRRRLLHSTVAAGGAVALTPSVFPTLALARPFLSHQRSASGYDPNEAFEVQVVDVPYRQVGGQAWLARVYQPQGEGPFPALVELHGGVWTDNDRTFDEPINKALAASGLVVAAIDFRQGKTEPYPSSLADINLAIRWLKTHAADFNADSHVVGGFGGSSGGHLIVLSAMRPNDPRYAEIELAEGSSADATLAYVVGHSPVIDPAARYKFAQQVGRDDLVGKQDGYFGNLETMEEASPLRILQRQEDVVLPPMLILHGTADMNVPVAEVEDFTSAYRATFLHRNLTASSPVADATMTYREAGDLIELQEFPGMPHYFLHPAVATGAEPERGLRVMKEFIAKKVAALAQTT